MLLSNSNDSTGKVISFIGNLKVTHWRSLSNRVPLKALIQDVKTGEIICLENQDYIVDILRMGILTFTASRGKQKWLNITQSTPDWEWNVYQQQNAVFRLQ